MILALANTIISEYLDQFASWIEDDGVWVDEQEILIWERTHPQPYNRNAYQGTYQDPGALHLSGFIGHSYGYTSVYSPEAT